MALFGGSKYSEAVRADAAVLFFEYHGLSRHAERLSPDESVRFLLEYYRTLGDVIFRTPARAVKYFGDQILVACGVPDAVSDSSGLAVALGFEMRRAFQALADRWKLTGIVPMIGIDTGSVVAGYFGHPKHFEFMVMGEPVRVAQQAAACALEGQILATARTVDALAGKVRVKEFTAVKVRSGGQERELPVYELEGWR